MVHEKHVDDLQECTLPMRRSDRVEKKKKKVIVSDFTKNAPPG